MKRVFISFLGLGSYSREKKIYAYSPAVYDLDGRKSRKTAFVQVAELELLGVKNFDRIIIIATRRSHEANFRKLREELSEMGVGNISHIIISEDMSPQGQWAWFENILNHIGTGDQLTIDLTHGYRSVPIVFSAAINFLQKARHIELKAVYYGAYEMSRTKGFAPIFDMKAFYFINEWAEAVSRLVEDADAGKMARVAGNTAAFQIGELNDPDLIQSFVRLTDSLRNVDINRVSSDVSEALRRVNKQSRGASESGKLLLSLVTEKFSDLVLEGSDSGRYDKGYFRVQLEIIRVLLEHKLFMQAFTVMREFIGSIGMIQFENLKVDSSKGRKSRRRFSTVFVNMLQYEEDQWKFQDQGERDMQQLMPFYHKLKSMGIEGNLREFTRTLIDYRNGFDHAWTAKSGAFSDVEAVGSRIYGNLQEILSGLENNGLLN